MSGRLLLRQHAELREAVKMSVNGLDASMHSMCSPMQKEPIA